MTGAALAQSPSPSGLPRLIVCLVALHAAMATSRVAASLYLLKTGRPEWQVGVLLSMYAVAPMLLALWAGRLADRRGFHGPMRVALALAAVGALASLLSRHPAALALAALATGGALSVGAVGTQREAGLTTADPTRLKQVFAWVALGPAASNALSPALSGLVIDHVGFVPAFALPALAVAIAVVAARGVRARPVAPPAAGHVAPRRRDATLALWRLPALRALLLTNVVLAACWDAHALVVPVLGHVRGLSASQIGFVLAAFAAATLAVRLVLTSFGQRVDERRVLGAAMLVAGAVQVVYAWLPGAWGMAFGSAVLGLALGAVQPMMLALLHHVTPPAQHGLALGLRMFVTNAATVAVPSLFGVLASQGAPVAPMWLMAAALALSWWGSAAPRR